MENREIIPPRSIVTKEQFNLLECVRLFKTGANNIYLVDDAGRYQWRAAQKGKSHFTHNADGS